MKILLALILTTIAGLAGAAPAKPLAIDVFTGDAAGFHVTSTLISGEKDMLLVDAQFTRSEAHKLVARILKSGKQLRTILVTHAHPDHYFGVEVIRAQFPNVKVVATKEVAAQMASLGPAKLAEWKPHYGNDLTDVVPAVDKVIEGALQLEGRTLQVLRIAPAEIEESTVVFIPESRTLIAGDAVYAGVHPWLAETNAERRQAWLQNLQTLADLKPSVVVAGHMAPGANLSVDSLASTATYIKAFTAALATAKTPEALIATMQAKYPDLALPIILQIAAAAMFQPAGHHH